MPAARALGYGRTSDNVVALEVMTGTGKIVTLGQGGDDSAWPVPQLAGLVKAHLAAIRAEFGKFTRQISGYALEHLLPERFAPERFFVGSEGTLGIVLRARVKLVADAPVRQMVALGYERMDLAGDDILSLLPFKPTAAEGLDDRTIDVVRRLKGPEAVPPLPRGQAYLFVELAGEDPAEVAGRGAALIAAAHAVDAWKVDDPETAATLWKIRSDAAGLAGIGLERPAYASWEDAAVPPERIGDYLRDFEKLLAGHGLHGLPYGHFGEGCIHCRIDFPLDRPGGVAGYRAFMLEAADLVVKYGGSMSGEHGDGRARSELLARMYSPESIALFADIKRLFDPDKLLNPGVLVDPWPTGRNIRVAQTVHAPLRAIDPAFVQRTHQCSGVGKCLADSTGTGGVMCPSYLITGNQLHSPRGRARVLQEMINGQIMRGWLAPELQAAFDLCLACKGCRKDCPADVDMAARKSRILYESYKHRPRPLSHYALGWLPRWGRLVSRVPGAGSLVNFMLEMPGLKQIALRLAGVDTRRTAPRFRTGGSARAAAQAIDAGEITGEALAKRPSVVIWVDSFTDAFAGAALPALIQVLLQAGLNPKVLQEDACCGLTWITTGQYDGARAQLRHALDVLAPVAEAGIPIVGMEPACISVWRSDAPELLPGEARVPRVARCVRTLAELLDTVEAYQPPDLSGRTIVAQPHCHHASVLGWAADARLLERTGAKVVRVGCCCGLAGSFGFERGHYDVSVKVFEHDLKPAIEAAAPDAIVLADGFSCRKQMKDLAGIDALTLAQVLAGHGRRADRSVSPARSGPILPAAGRACGPGG